MNNSENIRDKIDTALEQIQEENVNVISKDKILEIFRIFKNLDMDLIPVMDILEYAVENITDDKVNSLILRRVLKFYGLGTETDILETRQKISIVGNKLIKKPFLKKENIEMINILLQENNII
jgi:predicted transcriptional regulator